MKPLIAGKLPEINSETDNYNARSLMYGSVLSGGLAGHVYGSLSWPGVTTGEPEYSKKEARRGKHFWEPLEYEAHGQMQFLWKFVLSEGAKYQELVLASDDLQPRKSSGALDVGFEGWAHLMCTEDKKLALLYFERACDKAVISNMLPDRSYKAQWFDPRTGAWSNVGDGEIKTDSQGKIIMPNYPGNMARSDKDWALKLKVM
jgi:hypothetical protein